MIIALPPNARTTPAVRTEIAASSDSVAVPAALLLAGMRADRAGWWQAPSFDPFQPDFAWSRSLMCEMGWGGDSQGLWGVAGGIVLFGFLPAWLLWANYAFYARLLQFLLPPSALKACRDSTFHLFWRFTT